MVHNMAVSANEASGRRLNAICPGQYALDGGNGPTGTFIIIPSYSFLSFVLSIIWSTENRFMFCISLYITIYYKNKLKD